MWRTNNIFDLSPGLVEAGHRTGANCGEPMAAIAWARSNQNKSLRNSKVVTSGTWKPGCRPKQIGVMDLCLTDRADHFKELMR